MLVLVIVAVVAMTALPAAADQGGSPNDDAEFGQHHAEHARNGDLGKEMNPGMHQGNSNWDPDHCDC